MVIFLNFSKMIKNKIINQYSYKGYITRVILFNLINLYHASIITNTRLILDINNTIIREYILNLIVLNYTSKQVKCEKNNIIIKSKALLDDYNKYIIYSRLKLKKPISRVYVKSILCSIYLNNGTVIDPKREYRVEFRNLSNLNKSILIHILGYYNLKLREGVYRNKKIYYLLGYNSIIVFLNLLGLYGEQLRLEELKIIKDLRNNINRQVNGETANLNKTINYASRQIIAIKKIGIENLPSKLGEVARLRLEYPDASLSELATLFKSISKAGIRHRLNKIVFLADSLSTKG